MKRLPPSGSGNGKLPSRCPPPGHPALQRDFHVRFDMLTQMHRSLVTNYEELKHVSGSDTVRYLMSSLELIDDEDVCDKLEWLWPNVENIHCPPRKYYALRCSVLVGGFPSAAPHSPEVFTNTLLSRVLVKAPSCMVLEAACCELIDTYKYSNAPNIADLLALIEKHKALWQKRLEILREVESGRAREFAERRLAYEEEYEQRKVDDVVRRLTKVKQLELAAKVREGGIDMVEQAMPTLEKWERVGSVARRLDEVGRFDLATKLREAGISMVEEMMRTADELEREEACERRREREREKYRHGKRIVL
jgi:hypothetical protein